MDRQLRQKVRQDFYEWKNLVNNFNRFDARHPLLNILENLSGTKLVSPFLTASKAGFARLSILTNHCFEIMGSTIEWQR